MDLQQTGEGSLLVTWTASTGDTVNGYIIYYQRDGGEEESSMVDGGATTSTTIMELSAGTYSVTMVATSTSFPSSNTTAQTVEIGNHMRCPVTESSLHLCLSSTS